MFAFNLVKVIKSLDAATKTLATRRASIASALASRVFMLVVRASTLSVIETCKSVPEYLIFAAVSMPTSKLPDVTGEIVVFVDGSFVSDILIK